MKKLFLSLLSIPLLFSCAVDEFCTYSYNAKHLIDVYYSSQNIRIETMPGTIVCLSDDFSTACYSSEFAKFLNLEQSSQMQRNFLDIAAKNNDNCEWQVSFTQMKDKRLTPDDVVCNTALDKGISKIELKSNLDFDAKHPAGTSLMDVVDMSVVVLGKELSKTSGFGYVMPTTKPYTSYTKEEMKVIGPGFSLNFTSTPTTGAKHHLTLEVTFDDGEVFTDTVEVNF